MIEFSLLLITLVKEFVGLMKVCVECYLAFVELKKHFNNKTPKKRKSTNSRKRTDRNSTPSKNLNKF